MTTGTGNLTRAEAQARQHLLSDVGYEISLVVEAAPDAATFLSVTTVRFTAATASPTFLDLSAESVDSVTLNGKDIGIAAFDGTRLTVDAVVEGENTLTVHARCRYQHTGVGLHRVVDPIDNEVYLYTHCEPFDAHNIFACFDQPDLKARLRTTVTAPAAWEVVSNYPVTTVSQLDEDTRRHEFETTPLLPSYLFAVIAGPYHHVHQDHHGTSLGLYCRQSLAEHLDTGELFELTGQGLDFFSDFFAMPYPFAKYDQLFVPEFNMGAMENPGCVTFNEGYIFRAKVTDSARGNRANTILHEMAHMWFGDLVTMQWWDDLWLNESFATYMAHLAEDKATRFQDSWVDFATSMKSWAMRQDQMPSTHPISADMKDTDAVRLNFDGITYAKGASVLRQLVAWVGDDAFRLGLRQYMQDHQWANASLSDFMTALEKSSGRSLTHWASDWLQTTGVNALRPEIETANGVITGFAVLQAAPPEHPTLRSHRIGIGLYEERDKHLQLREHLDVDISGERTAIPQLVGRDAAPLVLLNDGDFSFAKVRLDQRSTETMLTTTGRIDDPLARALCWASLWDMTRDGELATRDYVSIFTRQARLEEEISTLERFVAQVLLAADVYSDPANRLAARQQIHETAVAALAESAAGSDVQLVWAQCLIRSSETAAELDEIADWLKQDSIRGLRIDTDVRWSVVIRLAAAGRIGAGEIEEERQRDPTDIGNRQALAARAARPDAGAKAEAWDIAVIDPDRALQLRASVMRGFMQAGQDELLRPYVARFRDVIDEIWESRSADEALEITEGLFPRYLAGDEVLAMADALLAAPLPPQAHRLIGDARDGTRRARHAREVDARAQQAPVAG